MTSIWNAAALARVSSWRVSRRPWLRNHLLYARHDLRVDFSSATSSPVTTAHDEHSRTPREPAWALAVWADCLGERQDCGRRVPHRHPGNQGRTPPASSRPRTERHRHIPMGPPGAPSLCLLGRVQVLTMRCRNRCCSRCASRLRGRKWRRSLARRGWTLKPSLSPKALA